MTYALDSRFGSIRGTSELPLITRSLSTAAPADVIAALSTAWWSYAEHEELNVLPKLVNASAGQFRTLYFFLAGR